MLPDGYSTVYELMSKGGVIMWPILLCSIVALTITFERFYFLRRISTDAREFMDMIRTALRQDRTQEAVQICDEANTPLARIVKAGILKQDRTKEEIRQAIEDAGHLEIPRMERYLAGLATCANITPLLGLLGTIQGMIKCFSAIEHRRGQVNPSDLAEGIGTALVTTFAGLCVAIPTLVAYNYFVARVDSLIVEMEIGSSELMDLLANSRRNAL